MTPAAQLSASQIKDRIEKMMIRHGYRCDYEELQVVHEAIRRVEEYELLVQQLLPDMQKHLAELEAKAANERGRQAREAHTGKEVRQDGPHLCKSRRPGGVGQRTS
jgi:HPt (histidine-containing phosphotransfer) domain-containing protein